jgi:hypothetical protein
MSRGRSSGSEFRKSSEGQLAAVRWPGVGGVQIIQVVAIRAVAVVMAIAGPEPGVVVHGMLVKRRTKMIDMSDAADVSTAAESTEVANAANVSAAAESTEVATAADVSTTTESTHVATAADVSTTTESTHVATAAEAAAVSTAATASGVRRSREQA